MPASLTFSPREQGHAEPCSRDRDLEVHQELALQVEVARPDGHAERPELLDARLEATPAVHRP